MMLTHWVRSASTSVGVILAAVATTASLTRAAAPVEPSYIKSLAASGKTVLVVEYYDSENNVLSRKGFASVGGFRASSPVDIDINGKSALHLYGVEPCQGDMANRREGFSGSCADFAQQQLQRLLKSPKVILCRGFLSAENADRQDVTCFGYYYFPGSLDSVENFEEQLLSLGALRLKRKPNGSLMRPDLAAAERIGRQGFGMWADPRTPQ